MERRGFFTRALAGVAGVFAGRVAPSAEPKPEKSATEKLVDLNLQLCLNGHLLGEGERRIWVSKDFWAQFCDENPEYKNGKGPLFSAYGFEIVVDPQQSIDVVLVKPNELVALPFPADYYR